MEAFGITKTDLISTAICTIGSYITKEPLGMTAATQLGSILIAKQLSPKLPVVGPIGPVTNVDVYTGVTRAGIKKFGFGASAQNAGIAGLKSIASNVIARSVAPMLEPVAAAPATETGL